MPSEKRSPLPLPLEKFPLPPEKWAYIVEEKQLSDRHQQIVQLILCGHSNKDIAAILSKALKEHEPEYKDEFTFATLKQHLQRIYRYFDVEGARELVSSITRMSHESFDS